VLSAAASVFGLSNYVDIAAKLSKLGTKIKESIGDDDELEYLARNSFYLGRYDMKGNSPCNVDGDIYDWNLWGAGRYGLYKLKEKRAYSEHFKHSTAPDEDTGKYEILSKSQFKTSISIHLGDVY
jgi:hypothetical protein